MRNTHAKIYAIGDARRLARHRLPRLIYDFVDGAVGEERAAVGNLRAFSEILLQPRVLADTDNGELQQTILGEKVDLPFGIAPMGMCNLVGHNTDNLLAAAAVHHNIPLGVSVGASTSMEEMYRWAGDKAWFQLYPSDSVEATCDMAKRAQDTGYTHLILTADVPRLARRPRDLKNGFRLPFRIGVRQFMDFALHPKWSLTTLMHGIPRTANFSTADGFVRTTHRVTDWVLLDKLRDLWRGKLIIKGVLSSQDAQRIQQAGADAIYVSNHGGRQLDCAPPAIAVLASIRATVGADYPIIFDSGVRSGEDVMKALVLGADFVMIGRPMLYAIAAGGRRGLDEVVAILSEDIRVTMSQLGIRRIRDARGLPLALNIKPDTYPGITV